MVLSTKSVFTTKQAKALINAKEAAEEAKQKTKNTRGRLRKKRKEIATITKAQVQERKKAQTVTIKAKIVTNQHKKALKEANQVAKKVQKASISTGNIAKRKETTKAYMAAA